MLSRDAGVDDDPLSSGDATGQDWPDYAQDPATVDAPVAAPGGPDQARARAAAGPRAPAGDQRRPRLRACPVAAAAGRGLAGEHVERAAAGVRHDPAEARRVGRQAHTGLALLLRHG